MALKCKLFNFRLWLWSIFIVTTNAAINYNAYKKSYIEDLCLSQESFQYELEDRGLSSALKIEAPTYYSSFSKNCTIQIHPTVGSGIILRVNSMYYGPKTLKTYFESRYNVIRSQCFDFIEVFGDAGNSSKLCGFLDESSVFVAKEKIKLLYYTGTRKILISGVGFILIATSYTKADGFCEKTQFTCASGECIWRGFACDGIENCPDGSDEKQYCADIEQFTMNPIDWDWNRIYPTSNIMTYRKSFNVTISAAIAAAVLILIVGLIRVFCHYHFTRNRHRDIIQGITIIRARSANCQNSRAPPPPYTSLVNEAAVISTMPLTPPDYSSVVQGTNAEGNSLTDCNNTSEDDRNETSQYHSPDVPPPPYEP